MAVSTCRCREIPTLASLGVIIVTLVITTVASLYKTRVVDKKAEPEGTAEPEGVAVPPDQRSASD